VKSKIKIFNDPQELNIYRGGAQLSCDFSRKFLEALQEFFLFAGCFF